MNTVKINITYILMALAIVPATESKLNAEHIFAHNSGKLSSSINYHQLYAQASDVLTQEFEKNLESFKMLAERHEILLRKSQEMKKEYQILAQEKEQLNADLQKLIKRNKKKRDSRTIKQAEIFRGKKEKFNAKYAGFLRRKEALDKELNEFRVIMEQLGAAQPAS